MMNLSKLSRSLLRVSSSTMLISSQNMIQSLRWMRKSTLSVGRKGWFNISTREFATEIPKSVLGLEAEERDIVIVGGGVAGLALACKIVHGASLSNFNKFGPKITIIERFPLSKPNDGRSNPDTAYANRVVSLTPSSAEFLREIGVWKLLDHTRVRGYQHIRVWDGLGGGMLKFDSPADIESMAYMVELNNLSGALMAKLQETNVELLGNTAVTNIHHPVANEAMDWPKVELEGGRLLRSRLLVGADGANSPVRVFAGIESMGWDYNQHGVVSTLEVSQNDANCAWQRFLPTGTLALLPLDATHASMVWSLPPDFAEKLRRLPHEQLSLLINAGLTASPDDVEFLLKQAKNEDLTLEDLDLSWRPPYAYPEGLPSISSVHSGSVATFPLRMRHVNRYVVPRVALVGDAAHTIHPLAGQGLNLGLADANSLGFHVVRGLLGGSDVGSLTLLQGYSSDRYWPNLAMLGATDKINHLFRANDGIVPTLRSFGFDLLDKYLPSSFKAAAVRVATKGWPL